MSDNTAVETAKKALTIKPLPEKVFQDSDFASFGLTLLNLATYGKTFGGVAKGTAMWLRGRASGGKTFLARNILCEASMNKEFQDYQLIYDDVEHGALMDTEKFWPPLVRRLVPPAWTQNKITKAKRPYYSKDIGEFYKRLRAKLDSGKKFIWIEDSMDALNAVTTTKMSDNKAKANSQELRRLMDPLHESGSILILISQARANLNDMFGGDISAGGRALEHYPSCTVTLRKFKSLCRYHNDKKWPVGSLIQAHVEKNRISGFDSTIYFPIYFDYGIDDIGSCIDWLSTAAGYWEATEEGTSITAPEFNFEGKKWDLIRQIELKNQLRDLRTLTAKVWYDIRAKISVKRMPRYS